MHVMVINVQNFYRALSVVIFSQREKIIRTSRCREKHNREAVEKYTLVKMIEICGHCNCQPKYWVRASISGQAYSFYVMFGGMQFKCSRMIKCRRRQLSSLFPCASSIFLWVVGSV